jgi:guanylate kinase
VWKPFQEAADEAKNIFKACPAKQKLASNLMKRLSETQFTLQIQLSETRQCSSRSIFKACPAKQKLASNLMNRLSETQFTLQIQLSETRQCSSS